MQQPPSRTDSTLQQRLVERGQLPRGRRDPSSRYDGLPGTAPVHHRLDDRAGRSCRADRNVSSPQLRGQSEVGGDDGERLENGSTYQLLVRDPAAAPGDLGEDEAEGQRTVRDRADRPPLLGLL